MLWVLPFLPWLGDIIPSETSGTEDPAMVLGLGRPPPPPGGLFLNLTDGLL